MFKRLDRGRRINLGVGPMPYLVVARDGAGQLMLTRETLEAAEKKASELQEMGCFDVKVIEKEDREACSLCAISTASRQTKPQSQRSSA
jgi:hypothetical protein